VRGGMDTEDLTVGDFNGDKRPDIVASGRATRNIKIDWNETPKKKAWADDRSFGVRGGSAG
jgi:hypothetical protein